MKLTELAPPALACKRQPRADSLALSAGIEEIEQLRTALERASTSHGQVVAVVGEPGLGKSRLFHEFTRSHRTQRLVDRRSGSVSYGKATPYLPLIDLLKATQNP